MSTGLRASAGLALFLVLGVLVHRVLKAGEWSSEGWSVVLLLAFAGFFFGVLLRDKFGKVFVEVNDRGLTVMDGLFGKVRPTRLDRESIDGFWVQCGVDEYGPNGHYALMVDQHAARSRVLFGSVAGLGPWVVLAERLAVRLHVPCDTRGSDFR
jgi:hypothetical protein